MQDLKRPALSMDWIDLLRVLSAFAVVTLHVSGDVVEQRSESFTWVWWMGNLIDAATRWCVPVFVMVSGALLLKPRTPETAQTFYLKRLRRLCIPIVFWSAFYMSVRASFGKGLTVSEAEWSLLTGNPFHHLWYLYMIFGLYLFTPFFRTFLGSASRSEFGLLVVILLTFSTLTSFWNSFVAAPAIAPFITMFLPFIGYYLCGAYLAEESASGKPIMGLSAIVLVSILASSAGHYFVHLRAPENGYFRDWQSFGVITLSVSLFALFSRQRERLQAASSVAQSVIGLMASASFGIYLIHPFFQTIMARVGFLRAGMHPALAIPVFSIVVFVLSLLATLLISEIPFVKEVVSPRTSLLNLIHKHSAAKALLGRQAS